MLIHVPHVPTDHAGPEPQWKNEIRGICVYHRLYHLVSINPLYQSSQGPGNPSRSEVLSTDTPRSPLPLPLLFPQCGWKQVLMENYFLILLKSMTLLSQYAVPLSLSNATQPSHSIFLFFSLTLAPCFCATSLEIKSLSLAHTPPSCQHFVSPLLFHVLH